MNASRIFTCLIGIVLCLPTLHIQAEIPQGFRLMEDSESPDGKFGVLEPADVPDEAFWKSRNLIVETKTDSIVGAVEGVPGAKRMNHGGAKAKWSQDSGLLLWIVDGKWGPRTVTFVKIAEGEILRQSDLIKAGYAEILKRSKAAFPKAYAAALKQNQGSGSAYPGGFTVAVTLQSPEAALPANFVVTLTSNPKGIEDFPKQAVLEGYLFGTLTKTHKVKWGRSGFFDATALERLISDEEGSSEVLAHQWDATLDSLPKERRKKLGREQEEWENSTNKLEEFWPVAQSVSPCLVYVLRIEEYEKRTEALSAMTPK